MAFNYPEFHGKKGEDVEQFLEEVEVACITNHVVDPVQSLHLLQIYLKGEVRAWLKSYKAGLQHPWPPVALVLDNLKEALVK